jgi:hypothetical protein
MASSAYQSRFADSKAMCTNIAFETDHFRMPRFLTTINNSGRVRLDSALGRLL